MERGSTADRSLSGFPGLTQHLAGAIHTVAKVIFRMQICSYHSPVSDPSTASFSFKAKDQNPPLAYKVQRPGPSSPLQPCLTPLSSAICLIHTPSCPRAVGCCSFCLESSPSTCFRELVSTNTSALKKIPLLQGLLHRVPGSGHVDV